MIESYNNKENNITNPEQTDEEIRNEVTLRPEFFSDFIGQKDVIDNLNVYIAAAKQREEALDHVLLFGPPGLGKTTLAGIISKEMNTNIKVSSGPVIARAGDLAGILTNFSNNDIFFIDEIHRINSVVEEYLYSAMEDFKIDIMIDQGPNARSVQLNLNRFTLVGATTRLGNLTAPMRDRFGVILHLDFYNFDELYKIILRSSKILDVKVTDNGAQEIARRSRGTPRIANRLLKRIRDFAQIENNGQINREVAMKSMERLGVDEYGLDNMDRKIIKVLVEKFNGGPVGLESMSVAISEDAKTIEEVYEPYLIKEGFLQRTSKGRIALDKSFNYLGLEKDGTEQTKIFN